MSEEILKALTQLFAIISKQDDGVSENERQFVIRFFQQELDHSSISEYIELYDRLSEYKSNGADEPADKARLTSVKDSVRTLGICRKINKTLTQKQKVVVLIKLLELVGCDKNFTSQRMEIINTVSTVFNIAADEYQVIEAFVAAQQIARLNYANVLVADSGARPTSADQKHLHLHIDGELGFLRVKSVDMYFVKYLGDESNLLNGFTMHANRVYLFSHGGTIKTQSGSALYFSDLVANFNEEIKTTRISFNASIKEFRFRNGTLGLKDVQISEGPGKLIGIMGASGAGKTTLLNVLAGLETPTNGTVTINGIAIHEQKEKIHGVIGYVPQDDLLIEELTVYQNLYFNAKLCFGNYSEDQLDGRVMELLKSLGLDHRKDLRVGNSLEKTISGGQRKRLNIALELIREPALLFLDEPTSGLSSRDSENVIDLLKELSLKGKLIFVVIHQPSSDIFKMFDKMIIMDTGGYPVYYGTPVEAVTYFKKATHQVDSNRGQCEMCGNVNPEQIFSTIEAKVVDEYGQPTSRRKVTPQQWNEMYQSIEIPSQEEIREDPPKSLYLPSRIGQTVIFTTRDLLAKLSNRQYLLINLIEAPLLASMLALVIRYNNNAQGDAYSFRFNDNIPAYLLMSIIVALFMGLTVSAEEIIRDRKILKRESFLSLSWTSYLVAKLTILFTLSAMQTLMFVIVGNMILGIHGMTLQFWIILFSTSCFANVLGLNISAAFNSAVTVYIVIPLLLIPQMIFSGTIFSFDKLNQHLSTKGKVPIIADLMASRWAYEAMAVYQFRENKFQKNLFEFEKGKSIADFKATYLAGELKKRTQQAIDSLSSNTRTAEETVARNLLVIRNSLQGESFRTGAAPAEQNKILIPEFFTLEAGNQLLEYLNLYQKNYHKIYNDNVATQEMKISFYADRGFDWNDCKNNHYNESLADLVRNVNTVERVVEVNGKLIQRIDPIFKETHPEHPLDYRTAFFSSQKHLLGLTINTFCFNVLVIWFMSGVLYLSLYTQAFRKILNSVSSLTISPRKKQTN